MKRSWSVLGGCLLLSAVCVAQNTEDDLGFDVGVFHVRPEVFAEASYDDRVAYDVAADPVDDFYGELGAAVYLNNADARYRVSGHGMYGYRKYDENAALDDDFYTLMAAVSASDDPLKYGFSGLARKSLDYDTTVDLSTGLEPGAILTNGVSGRYSVRADVSYEKQLGDKTALVPSYSFSHYLQDFEMQEQFFP